MDFHKKIFLKMFVFQRTHFLNFVIRLFFFPYLLSLWKCLFFKEQNYPKMKAYVFPTKHFFFLIYCLFENVSFSKNKIIQRWKQVFFQQNIFFSYIHVLSIWKCLFFKEQISPMMKAYIFPTKHFFFHATIAQTTYFFISTTCFSILQLSTQSHKVNS
jgi:hypothetical protein